MSKLDDPSFEEFVDAELTRLVRLARLLCRSEHDAWDLAQEALVRVGLRWSNVSRGSNPAAYARRTIVNLNLNRVRRLRRELLTSAVPDIASEQDRPSIPWLDRALDDLSPRQRAAVALAYWEDLPVVEIADLMGCSESAAKTHLSRARAALGAALRSRGISDPPFPKENASCE